LSQTILSKMKSQHVTVGERSIFSIIENGNIGWYSLAPKRKKNIKNGWNKSSRKFSVEQFLFQKFFDIVNITGNTAKKPISGGCNPHKKSSTGGVGWDF